MKTLTMKSFLKTCRVVSMNNEVALIMPVLECYCPLLMLYDNDLGNAISDYFPVCLLVSVVHWDIFWRMETMCSLAKEMLTCQRNYVYCNLVHELHSFSFI
jgi:hypothetical protein